VSILFLDFDGVLHTVGGQVFHPDCLAHLESAIEGHDVEIVIASSWREVHGLDTLRGFLGERLGVRVRGVTPVINQQYLKYCRYFECLDYLKNEGLSGHPWVAVDDEPGCYPSEAPVILTNYLVGFTRENAIALDELIAHVAQFGGY